MSSFSYKGILSILVSVFLVSGIIYASSTIISVQTQSIAQGDVIANGWFQEVNDSILSQRTGINTLSGQIQTLSGQINGSIGNQWSNYPNNTSPTGIYYPVGNVGIGVMPTDLNTKFKVQGIIETSSGAGTTGGIKFPDGTLQTTAYSGSTGGDGTPVGTISAFFTSSCPTGWILADGTNGTPDLRGEFIRGLDNGRGVDSGRSLGSSQLDSIQTITGSFDVGIGNIGARSLYGNGDGVFNVINGSAVGQLVQTVGWTSSSYTMGHNFDSSRVVRSSKETRPRNIALLYCMKLSGASSTPSNNTTWTRIGNNVVQASTGVVQVNSGIQFPDGSIQTSSDKPISVCRPTINRTMSASSSSAYQQVIFDERKLDTNSFCNTSNSRFQPTKAGYYKINVNLGYAATTAGGGHTVYMLIAKNDTTTEVNSYTLHNYTSSYQNTLFASTIVYLNGTTDYLTIKAFTNNTSGTTTILNGDNTHFEAEFLRP